MNTANEPARTFRWSRPAALGLATLFALCAVLAVSFAYSRTSAPDFLSYWAAGRLTFEGHPALAYDIARHHAVEGQISNSVGMLPFPYPPPFLLVVLPFGIAPMWIAFAAWIAITLGLYVAASWRMIDVRFALAQAAAAANFIVGQNGFLTSAIFIRGTALLATRPLLAGATLGLLFFKPQLALLLPIALIAGREWRAIGGGILCTVALGLLGLLLFGAASYRGFLAMLPQFTLWLNAGRWSWGELASIFAFLRFFGVPHTPAFIVHATIAIAAAAMTAHAWATKSARRIPILAASTLLASPYLFTYDGLLLVLPMAGLMRQESRRIFLTVWILSLLPVIAYFRPFPNTIPIAAMLALWTLRKR